jgi:hypothetical protein
MKHIVGFLGATALGISTLVCGTSASAQQIQTRTITIDENGNGSVTGGENPVTLSFSMAADPGPGGFASVLTYVLPAGFSVVPGDVHLTDADFNDAFLDVIRFNQVVGTTAVPGTIAFYSDNEDGFDALADTSGPPAEAYTNLVSLPEIGPEGDNGAFYTPTANQPGFVSGFAVTYHFISDSAVPEPATWAMMLAGFGAMGVAFRRRRRRALALV